MSDTRRTLPVDAGSSWEATLAPDVRALADQLMPLFYGDLKHLARRERSRVSASEPLQTTALVNEAYLKLRGSPDWTADAHLLRAATHQLHEGTE